MSSFFDQIPPQPTIDRIAGVLEIQSEALGLIDVPLLLRELRDHRVKNVLDIGTGDGSFLVKIAERSPGIRFLGIEQKAELLAIAQARLSRKGLPNTKIEPTEFNSAYGKKHDAIMARFTLQHCRQPQEFVRIVFQSLKSGGLFICIEPIYDYYDCEPPDSTWMEFRKRMLATYQRWHSQPNIPKQVCHWLFRSGFQQIRVSVQMYSPITIGRDRFNKLILATAAMLYSSYPDIWEASFMKTLDQWTKNLSCDPFLSIAHIHAIKPRL